MKTWSNRVTYISKVVSFTVDNFWKVSLDTRSNQFLNLVTVERDHHSLYKRRSMEWCQAHHQFLSEFEQTCHAISELAFGRFVPVLAPGPIPIPKWIGPRPNQGF